jgi:hypothetical protein
MGVLSCTIGGNAVTLKNNSFSITGQIETRDTMTITVLDATGTLSFQPRQPVVLSDSVNGKLFSGYVGTSKPNRVAPSTAGASSTIEHVVTVIDTHYKADKQANQQNYTNAYAGDIALDFWRRALQAEGVVANAAIVKDSTVADFQRGIVSGTIATSNVGDGDLELVTAGSMVTVTESTTTDFASGTLTNVTAANNSLTPTPQSALRVTATLPGGSGGSFLSMKFWSSSLSIGTSDTINYDLWIASSSPEFKAAIDFVCSDGTLLSTSSVSDQNSLSAAPSTDLSKNAKDTWYTRNIAITALHGKTVTSVYLTIAGTTPGTYTVYVKNCYLGSQSGNKFLDTNATTTNVSPPIPSQFSGYLASTSTATLVQCVAAGIAQRVSPAHSIDAVKLLRSSLISWTSSSTVTLKVSYDGGASYQACTNGAPLPALPAGSNVAGVSLTLLESFVSGNDPTILPILTNVTITLQSAANATKSDIVTSYTSQSAMNLGTYTNMQSDASGNLLLTSYTRNWNDNTTTGQTPFFPSGTTDVASGGIYTMSVTGTNSFGTSRLDFLGQVLDFTLDCDIKASSTADEVALTYRQSSWVAATNNTFAYMVGLYPGSPGILELGHGSNSTNDSFTQIAFTNPTVAVNTFFHIKIVVKGTHHQIYFNNSTTPTIDVIDSTYTQVGGIGCRAFGNTGSASWDNLVLSQAPTGTWLSNAVSLTSLGSCGQTAISWTEKNTSVPTDAYDVVQTSVDGGSTFQVCTNQGAIPNLPSGSNVAGKTVQVKVTLGSISNTAPSVSTIVWRVLGAYPGSSGTRTTLPMGMDSMTRANVGSGWGTATDSQTYTQVGTGTTALTSNEGLITNTTGDVHMLYGSRTWTDEDGTCRFSLSAATISAGIELRYTDTNNFYRFSASTTTLTLTKKIVSNSYTLATASMTLSTGVFYRMRFRVAGNYPTTASGKVWLDGTLEPTAWNATFTE